MNCKLEKLFEMQRKLNNEIFKKQQITGRYAPEILTMEELIAAANMETHIGPNSLTNEWLNKYLTAMDDESRELRDELLWKFWSKDHLDMQNIRVEIVDQLHFWLSLAMSAGMGAQDVFRIYEQKNRVNLERQENGYSVANKTEDDNKGIK